ncbi:Uncharacterised protein [uncultured archaeon]|nr:Uncharacterised protein [uncultured archaeon]
MNAKIGFSALLLLPLLLAGCATQPSQQIGGDKDSHGCLIAAGYSWCEAKSKCIRQWEESCEAQRGSGEGGGPKVCTLEYAPVCGRVSVCPACYNSIPRCLAPCRLEDKTFGNRCQAEAENATILYNGECRADVNSDGNTPDEGLANPASVNCIDNNGTLKIVSDENGNQVGMCTLPGGKVCEEWAYLRGDCEG